jgi:hypothetical protein
MTRTENVKSKVAVHSFRPRLTIWSFFTNRKIGITVIKMSIPGMNSKPFQLASAASVSIAKSSLIQF